MPCPTYLDLSMYDTYSEPYYGEVYPTSIIGERYEENYNLSPRHYSILNTTLILADPPINMLLNSKSITIQPRVLVAHTTNMSDTSTRSIQIEQKMYINDACDRAIIAADHWEEMLPITIVNMLYNCSPAVYDPYDTTIMIPHPLVPYTHDESISYQTLLHWRMVAEQCSTGYQVCR